MESMMFQAPNSQFFLADEWASDLPGRLIRPVAAASEGILVGTRMWQDGPTEVRVSIASPGNDSVSPNLAQVFDGSIRTQSRAVVISDVHGVRYYRLPVPDTETRVRVAVNSREEPDLIELLIG